MSKIDQVRAEMMTAMKQKDKPRKDALSLLLSALKNKAIDKRAELTEQEENDIVLHEMKQARETLESAPASRQDIIDECNTALRYTVSLRRSRWTKPGSTVCWMRCCPNWGWRRPASRIKGAL